ncbi:hypothetical protein DID88_004608 [Monilinia fructigena]|uniref:MINDY deubiquitinase domain-containing protein n=1 Tax=Monilinia fructigena TaxID=38457 RepID=A0A395IRS1_9HELO|nr:hypothetical protein DID88_004608 [Monilinia fructigena]
MPCSLQTNSGSNIWKEEEDSHSNLGSLPDSLKVGQSRITPKPSQDMLKPNLSTTNPFLRRKQSQISQGAVSDGKESSADIWNELTETPARPNYSPPPPPVSQVTQQLSNMEVSEQNTNPWQPLLNEKQSTQTINFQREDSGNEAWSSANPQKAITPHDLPDKSRQPVLVDVDEPESPAWDEDGYDEEDSEEKIPASPRKSSLPTHKAHEISEDQHAWDLAHDQQSSQAQEIPIPPSEHAQYPSPPAEGWNLIEHEAIPDNVQQSGVIGLDGVEISTSPPEEDPPALPPRNFQERPSIPPLQPPRPIVDATNRSTSSIATPVHQHPPKGIRKRPLVNALILSTPAGLETSLVETLRSREQISLGLLLDAVFDELMSGRRGDAAQGLPDLSHIHPTQREGSVPGTFEETREMKLYGTFSIPLIHGWLPEEESPAYMALKRSARSYEDAQNLMFHEEVLEDKLATEGLSFQEQGILEDIATIKAFFASAATQLTAHGLDLITTSISPGAVAILFRNDHFSTIFRHPTTLQLLQLVTDSGYARHEEVVFESLIDVNGERAEFYSGDFRLVGGAFTAYREDEEGNWTTVTGRRNTNRSELSHQRTIREPERARESRSNGKHRTGRSRSCFSDAIARRRG